MAENGLPITASRGLFSRSLYRIQDLHTLTLSLADQGAADAAACPVLSCRRIGVSTADVGLGIHHTILRGMHCTNRVVRAMRRVAWHGMCLFAFATARIHH